MNENGYYEELYKVILAGDANVGKTNLVHRFIKGEKQNSKNVSPTIGPTIGVQFATKTQTLNDGKKIKVQIWDTAGQQQYRSITMAHYRKALGALVVYDITKEQTFFNVKRWIDSIREHAVHNVVIVLVGNKIDLKNQQVVTTAEAKKVAKQLGVLFEETSAITNSNVDNTFKVMLEEIQKRRREETTKDPALNQGFYLNGSKLHNNNDDQKCEC